MRKQFLAIGLGRAALHEALTAASKRTARELLRSIPMVDWQSLPVEQAALLAADLSHYLLEHRWGDDDDDGSGAEDGKDSLSSIVKQLLNSLLRRQTLQGTQPTQAAREIMESILKLGRRSELTIRAFWHFVLHSWLKDVTQKADEAVFDASASVAAWKKLDGERFSFSSSEGTNTEEKAARKKAYRDHLSAAIVDEHERDEWNFMFQDDSFS